MASLRPTLGDFSSIVCFKALATSLGFGAKATPLAEAIVALRTALGKDGTRLCYVETVTKEGDDFRKLAQDLEMTHGMLARWNDMDKNAKLEAGQRIYIQPKRNASKSAAEHVAGPGETLWDVSQQYGVKLEKLAKYNGLGVDATLSTGQRIVLRKPRK